MAENRPESRPPELKEDPLVAALVPDPAAGVPNATTLDGFLGKSATEGTWRLYLDQDLSQYVELREAEILHAHELPEDRGTRVWVSKDLVLNYVRVDSAQVQASFLSGSISAGRLLGEIPPGEMPIGDGYVTFSSRLSCVGSQIDFCPTRVTCDHGDAGLTGTQRPLPEAVRDYYLPQPITSPVFCAPTALLLIQACREKVLTHIPPC